LRLRIPPKTTLPLPLTRSYEPAVNDWFVISNTLVPDCERSSVKPESTVTVPGLLPGRNDPSTDSDLPSPESVPTPDRLSVEGSEYVPVVRAARSKTPGLAVVPRFRPPLPMLPELESASVPPEIVVRPE
jgi:hypothetical protein